MSSGNVQMLVRKTRRSRGRNADFYMIHVSLIAELPAEFHIGDRLNKEQREHLRSLIYGDFPASDGFTTCKPTVGSLIRDSWPHEALAS
jgi:hypothetical protein